MPRSAPSHPARPRPASRPKRGTWVAIIVAAVLVLAGGIAWAAIALAADGDGEQRGLLGERVGMGGVELRVANLDLVRGFYEDAVGLDVLDADEDRAVLGADGRALITLEQERADTITPDSPSEAGLFHSAILFPSERDLAATLQRIADTAPERYQGSADHHVSQAFYFGDPEGNGLELYVDRPRDEWTWTGDRVQMGSDPLDPNQFIQQHLGDGDAADAVMGHVHLRVGDTEEAKRFYHGVLGFDVTAEEPDALFLSAGGYHHHLAANSWNSRGAGVRADGLGLIRFTVQLGSAEELAGI
ncbi:VOC family protein, partial [Leucobacter sp. M11]|uniref:VOC family protein n=1 Tax=Leucobacter sp. M11 TaxID=2993565 RepID=UPI002D80EA48